MKLYMCLSLLFLFICSCTTTKQLSMEPYKAKIPELRFDYEKNGVWIPVWGHGGDYFILGEVKKFRVKTHKNAGNCQIRVVDGDNDVTKDCNNDSEIIIDLGKFGDSPKEASVLGFSLATEKLGIQQGFFYPKMEVIREDLPVDYKCPYQAKTKNLSVCTRPATFDLSLKVKIESNKLGELKFKYKCDNSSLEDQTISITDSGEKIFTISSGAPTYCVVFFGLRQDKKPDGTYNIVKSRDIRIRFYDETYIPLPIPVVTSLGENKWEICAPEEYQAYSINGKDKENSLFTSDCVKYNGPYFEMDAWDSLGRFSWAKEDCVSRGKFFLNCQRNKFSFYQEAQPFVMNYLNDVCRNDLSCAKEHYKDVLRDPKMIEAIKEWDSSILYKE